MFLDADMQGYFDAISHGRLESLSRTGSGDERVLRQVRKWLKAGVMEAGEWRQSRRRARPKGGVFHHC